MNSLGSAKIYNKDLKRYLNYTTKNKYKKKNYLNITKSNNTINHT